MSANKCFSTGPNQFKTGQDYINRKKSQQLYTNAVIDLSMATPERPASANICTRSKGHCLGSVGGYNTNSYDLLLNLTKGAYYSATDVSFSANTTPPNCSHPVNKCLTVGLSSNKNLKPPNYTYGIYEGPFITNDISYLDISNCPIACDPPYLLSNNNKLAIEPLCNYVFTNMITQDKLRNFHFPTKLSFSNI